MFAAALRSLHDIDVTEPTRLVHCGLRRGPTDAREGCDFVDRQIGIAVVLHLAGQDEQHRALALGVIVPKIFRQPARSAKHSAAVS